MTGDFTFCVCTYNSANTLHGCLASIRNLSNDSRLLVVDHNSKDDALAITSDFFAEIHKETKGLGHARPLCLNLVNSEFIVLVDSDVEKGIVMAS